MNGLTAQALAAKQAGSHRQGLCLEVMERLRQFLYYGLPIDPFMTALICQDGEAARAVAPSKLLADEEIVPLLLEWVERHVPSNFFESEAVVRRWEAHKGLTLASENDRMWFYLKNNLWSPRRLARHGIHARA